MANALEQAVRHLVRQDEFDLDGQIAGKLDRILAEDKNNFEALRAMGESLRAAGLYLTSNDYYARALQRNEAKGDPSIRERILTDMGLNLIEVKDGKRAVELYEKCLKEFPSSPNEPEWTLKWTPGHLR